MAYQHTVYDQRHSSSLLLILVLNLLCCTGGKCVVVKTFNGDDTVLPCEVDPSLNPSINRTEMAIEWSRPDLPPHQYVHFKRNGDITDDQNPSYKGRTSLFMDEVKKGNVSLKLSTVTPSDEGNYTCILPEIPQKLTVQLIVGVRGSDSGSKEEVSPDGPAFRWWGYVLVLIPLTIIIISISILLYKKRHSILTFVRSRFEQPESTAAEGDSPLNDDSAL